MTPLLVSTFVAATALLVGLCRTLWALKKSTNRLRRAEQEARAISDLVGTLATTDWHQSIQGVLTGLVQSGACRAAVLLAPGETGKMEFRAAAYAPNEPIWDSKVTEHAQQVLDQHMSLRAGLEGIMLPVIEDGDGVGVLALRSGDPAALAVKVAIRLIALGLIAAKHYQRQVALTNTDGLTGLATHRCFQQTLGIALGQSYLEGIPLSVILLDIDHFKKVNDTYGHLLGDLVLREIAYLLRRGLPAGTLTARYGGEEMAVLLQGQVAYRAEELAEELRQTIASHEVFDFTSGAQMRVTVSMGLARYELGQGKNRLIARADEALYRSKREGRNRVTVAPSEECTTSLPVT